MNQGINGYYYYHYYRTTNNAAGNITTAWESTTLNFTQQIESFSCKLEILSFDCCIIMQ